MSDNFVSDQARDTLSKAPDNMTGLARAVLKFRNQRIYRGISGGRSAIRSWR